MNEPGFYTILKLSPLHMKPETREKVEGVMDGDGELDYLHVYPIVSGEYILQFDYKEIQHSKTPDDLRHIMNHAKANGAHAVYFDERAGIYNDLPVYGRE